jgi:hypothetical protein
MKIDRPSSMAKVLVDPLKQLLHKDLETSAIEQELSHKIETRSKVPGLTSIGLEYDARI